MFNMWTFLNVADFKCKSNSCFTRFNMSRSMLVILCDFFMGLHQRSCVPAPYTTWFTRFTPKDHNRIRYHWSWHVKASETGIWLDLEYLISAALRKVHLLNICETKLVMILSPVKLTLLLYWYICFFISLPNPWGNYDTTCRNDTHI